MSIASSCEHVADALYFLLREHERCILLIDQYGGNPLREALDAVDVPAATAPLNDPIFKDDMSRAPLLVELLHREAAHHALLQRSLALALEQGGNLGGMYPVCAWLLTDAPLAKLQRQLTSRLDLRHADGQQVYLRYFDPRVLPRLLEILAPGPELPAGLLGDVRVWCQLDRNRSLLKHQFTGPKDSTVFAGRWRVDVKQGAAIDRIAGVNLALRSLAKAGCIAPRTHEAAIDALLARSAQYGLQDAEDRIAFTWRAYLYGERFTTLPMLEQWIATALGEGIPLESMFEEQLGNEGADEHAPGQAPYSEVSWTD